MISAERKFVGCLVLPFSYSMLFLGAIYGICHWRCLISDDASHASTAEPCLLHVYLQ